MTPAQRARQLVQAVHEAISPRLAKWQSPVDLPALEAAIRGAIEDALRSAGMIVPRAVVLPEVEEGSLFAGEDV